MRLSASTARSSLVLLAVLLAACAGAGRSGPGGEATAASSGSRRSSDLLTQAEIQDAGVGSIHDIVQRLRPAWLRTRSGGSVNAMPQYAIVYIDGARVGGIETLRRLNAADVRTIRYLRGPDATTRFGTGHEGGAILVETKK